MKLRYLIVLIQILLGSAIGASAQSGGSFGLTWSTFGGSGTSSGGSYSISGTIGQPEAGEPMSGDAFTITGGLWPGVASEPVARLSIRLGVPVAGTNTVILTWPNPSTGYVLQQTFDMSAPGGGWTDVTQSPVIVGANNEVTLPAAGQARFFRLRGP